MDRVLRFLSIAVFFFKLNKRQNHQYASVWEYQLTLYSRYILNVTCRNLSWFVEFIYFIIKFHTIQHLAHRACKRRSRTFGWYCTLRIYQQTNHYSRFSIPFSVTKFSHMKKRAIEGRYQHVENVLNDWQICTVIHKGIHVHMQDIFFDKSYW